MKDIKVLRDNARAKVEELNNAIATEEEKLIATAKSAAENALGAVNAAIIENDDEAFKDASVPASALNHGGDYMNLAKLRSAVAESLDKIKSVSNGVEMVLANKERIERYKEIIPKIAEAFTVAFPESEFDFKYQGYDEKFHVEISLLSIWADEICVTDENKDKAKYLFDALNQYAESFSVCAAFKDGIMIEIGFPNVTVDTFANGIVLGNREEFTVGRKSMGDAFKKILNTNFGIEDD